MDIDELSPVDAPPQACVAFRKRKRKCDKQLPACGLCTRLGRRCDYTIEHPPSSAPSSEEFAALRQQVADLTTLITSKSSMTPPETQSSSDGSPNITSRNLAAPTLERPYPRGSPESEAHASAFPVLFFLDSRVFEYQGLTVPPASVKVPSWALSSLGTSTDLRAIVEHYFSTVHTYFPVICRIRLYQHLVNPVHEPDATTALLFFCMKLVCNPPPRDSPPQTQLYREAKALHQYVEGQNGFSVQTIQALILIALYELGHCIYPAAYLTIGHVARVAHAAGLHDLEAPQMLPRCTSWTEQEERRRLWWGIIILDRFVNIGHRSKPFATAEPGLEMHLPTDDAAWDRGQMLAAAPLSLSASPAIQASPFARTCQAAHLLGKAMRHIDDKQMPQDYRFSEALQLHRTMQAFADVVSDEVASQDGAGHCSMAPCASAAIIYCALLTLYESYSCTAQFSNSQGGGGESQLLMQQESIEGIRRISEKVVRLARGLDRMAKSDGLETLNPLVIDCLYQAAANYAWYVGESSDAACGECLVELKKLLGSFDPRWRAAGIYYRLIETWEYHVASNAVV